jgi:hypothetical protein
MGANYMLALSIFCNVHLVTDQSAVHKTQNVWTLSTISLALCVTISLALCATDFMAP